MERPDCVKANQRWSFGPEAYTVVAFDHEKDQWLTNWDDYPSEQHYFSSEEIMHDDFLGYITVSGDKGSLGERASQWLEGIATMLREKNKAYGNSLGDPVRIFTDIDPIKLTLARAEDKLSRIARGQAGGEDVPKDLVGYIALAVALGWNGEKLR